MKIVTHLFIILFLAASLSATAKQPPDSAVGPKLPPKVRGLLVEEMNAILEASQQILDALVRGDNAKVAGQAQAIHDSFILKQKMTPEDKQALLDAVPKAFIKRDKAFHRLSAQLAEAARNGNGPRQRKLFSKMVNACIDCHSHHADDRFPALGKSD